MWCAHRFLDYNQRDTQIDGIPWACVYIFGSAQFLSNAMQMSKLSKSTNGKTIKGNGASEYQFSKRKIASLQSMSEIIIKLIALKESDQLALGKN